MFFIDLSSEEQFLLVCCLDTCGYHFLGHCTCSVVNFLCSTSCEMLSA